MFLLSRRENEGFTVGKFGLSDGENRWNIGNGEIITNKLADID